MAAKFLYAQGFCPTIHYQCLMPVEYEKTQDGYRKHAMCCDEKSCGPCDQKTSCEIYLSAPEILPEEDNWKLKDLK